MYLQKLKYTYNNNTHGKQLSCLEFTCIKALYNKLIYIIHSITAPPTLDVKAYKDVVTIKAGNVLRLLIPYSGCPTPKVEWHRFDARIAEDTRTHIETRDSRTQLTIRNCQRSDTGKYTITLSNEAGQANAVIHINVVGEYTCTFKKLLSLIWL